MVPHLKQSLCVISTSLTKLGLAVQPGSSLQASWKYNIIDFIIDDTLENVDMIGDLSDKKA